MIKDFIAKEENVIIHCMAAGSSKSMRSLYVLIDSSADRR
jgi:hypothetical protein